MARLLARLDRQRDLERRPLDGHDLGDQFGPQLGGEALVARQHPLRDLVVRRQDPEQPVDPAALGAGLPDLLGEFVPRDLLDQQPGQPVPDLLGDLVDGERFPGSDPAGSRVRR